MEMSTEATKGLEMLRAPCRWESQSTVLVQQWGLRKYFSVVPLSADQQQKRYLKFISSMFVFLVGWGCLFFFPQCHKYTEKVDDMGLYNWNCTGKKPFGTKWKSDVSIFSLQDENKDGSENYALHTNALVGEQLQLLPYAWGFQHWQKRIRKTAEKEIKRREIRQNLASQERLLNCFRRDGGRRNRITKNDLGITNLTVP